MPDLENNLISHPALWRLRALMPRGLDSVRPGVLRALDSEDYSAALKLANAGYARRREQDYDAALTYACLLVGRELVVEARGILMRALEVYPLDPDRKSTRLNSSHVRISYAVFCLKKKKKKKKRKMKT